jgi:hypothetical protein
MGGKDEKTTKRDLLRMPDAERNQLIKQVREKLRAKLVEARLWQSFLEAENLTINGQTICSEDITLKGFTIGNLSKSA